MRDIVIIGGPNGAGKTTAAKELVPQKLDIREFVNADEIARGLSPFNPEGVAVTAGRLMIERMRELARDGRSFAFETTCAGRGHATFLRACKGCGWRISLLYLWLPSPGVAVERAARRVRQGGHGVPLEIVVRCYWAGLRNMRYLYLPLADATAIYDNSDTGRIPVAEKPEGLQVMVLDGSRWASLEAMIR